MYKNEIKENKYLVVLLMQLDSTKWNFCMLVHKFIQLCHLSTFVRWRNTD